MISEAFSNLVDSVISLPKCYQDDPSVTDFDPPWTFSSGERSPAVPISLPPCKDFSLCRRYLIVSSLILWGDCCSPSAWTATVWLFAWGQWNTEALVHEVAKQPACNQARRNVGSDADLMHFLLTLIPWILWNSFSSIKATLLISWTNFQMCLALRELLVAIHYVHTHMPVHRNIVTEFMAWAITASLLSAHKRDYENLKAAPVKLLIDKYRITQSTSSHLDPY